METNIETMFEHVNNVWNTDKPSDFLVSRQNWRKSASQFLTPIYMIEKCVLKSEDDVERV